MSAPDALFWLFSVLMLAWAACVGVPAEPSCDAAVRIPVADESGLPASSFTDPSSPRAFLNPAS